VSISAIEWTDEVWNPVTGCDRVSPGCANCYALELAPKLRRFALARARKDPDRPRGKWADVADGARSSGPAFGVTLHPKVLEQPLRWRKPRRVFVNSMSDLFHEEVPFEFVDRVFEVMAEADRHTFQVLTKRPERMLAYFEHAADHMALTLADLRPWPNVWLGVSIENRRFVGRADVLRATPAAVRFISAEPLLGPLIAEYVLWTDPHPYEERTGDPDDVVGTAHWTDAYEGDELDLAGIDWLIVGGESGPSHRPIREEWVRDLRDACAEAGTAFFFRQWGGRTPKSGGRELDGRTWDEFPSRERQEAAA
jgi:protein gp37